MNNNKVNQEDDFQFQEAPKTNQIGHVNEINPIDDSQKGDLFNLNTQNSLFKKPEIDFKFENNNSEVINKNQIQDDPFQSITAVPIKNQQPINTNTTSQNDDLINFSPQKINLDEK